MLYALGLLTGLLLSCLVFIVLTFYRSAIEQRIRVVERKILSLNPPAGSVYTPPTEVEEWQRSVIEENRKLGLSTNIEDIT